MFLGVGLKSGKIVPRDAAICKKIYMPAPAGKQGSEAGKKTVEMFHNLIVRKKSHSFSVFLNPADNSAYGKFKFIFNAGSRCLLYSGVCLLDSDYWLPP